LKNQGSRIVKTEKGKGSSARIASREEEIMKLETSLRQKGKEKNKKHKRAESFFKALNRMAKSKKNNKNTWGTCARLESLKPL